MLINNKKIIQLKNSHLTSLLNINEQTICHITESKSGVSTLTLQYEGEMISYHSRYNPIEEAKKILEQQLDDNAEYVLLIGVGLGYLVQVLNEFYPHVQYSIYEPDEAIMKCLLDTFDFSKVKVKNLDEIFTDINQLKNIEKFYAKLAEQNSIIVTSPIVEKFYKEQIKKFITNFKGFLARHKSSVITDLVFQSRWTINSIINLKEVLVTPNFFEDINLDKLTGKPVLIVAAGPSLDKEIENIRLIKEKGKAFIFAVGSAINTLIKYDILPHALFSYDPTKENAEVVKKVKELNLSIPLIFGTSIGFEVLQDYPGRKVHFFTSQDSISPNLVNSEKRIIIPDSPTIAAITLYIVGGIGMGPIIFVGQNLSITKEKTYAEGISYVGNTTVTDEILKSYKPVISTTNEEIYTHDGYLEMRDSIQHYISICHLQNKVYNSTENGLPIEGAPYIPLLEVIETFLTEDDLVDNTIFNEKNNYKIEDVLRNFKKFEEYFDSLILDFKIVIDMDIKIRKAYEKKLINNTQSLFNEFDKFFSRIENNPFFLQVIAPTTRNQYKQLIAKSEEVRYEKRPLQKMKKYIDIYSKYIRTIYAAIVEIQPAFAELKKSDLFKKEDSQ